MVIGTSTSNIIALTFELGVRLDLDLNQRVTGVSTRLTRRAAAFQTQHLPIDHAFRHGQIERAAFRQASRAFWRP